MFNLKRFIIAIIIPLLAGFIGNLLGNASQGFDSITKPSFTPPGILFPIVWTILYILMGISSYFIYQSNSKDKKCALIIYGIQLFFNMMWTFFFFRLKLYLFAFIWLIILIILVIVMIYKFYKIDKKAGLLQLPYLIWITFASILNFSIYLLN